MPDDEDRSGLKVWLEFVGVLVSLGLGGALVMGIICLILAALIAVVYGQNVISLWLPVCGAAGGFIGAILYALGM